MLYTPLRVYGNPCKDCNDLGGKQIYFDESNKYKAYTCRSCSTVIIYENPKFVEKKSKNLLELYTVYNNGSKTSLGEYSSISEAMNKVAQLCSQETLAKMHFSYNFKDNCFIMLTFEGNYIGQLRLQEK